MFSLNFSAGSQHILLISPNHVIFNTILQVSVDSWFYANLLVNLCSICRCKIQVCKDSASCVKDDCVKGLHVTNCKCEKEQKIPELLLRFKLQDILNSTYSTISIVAQMAAAEKFNKVYDLPPIIEENEDVDFIGVEEKNIEVVMSHANVDRGKAVTGYGFEE